MEVSLEVYLDTELFQLEDAQEAERVAANCGGAVYCWKACGLSNWLERGLSLTDVLCLVVLPAGLPEYIDMPDDDFTEDDFEPA